MIKKEIAKLSSIIAIMILTLSIQMPMFTLTKGNVEIFIKKSTGENVYMNPLPEIKGYNLSFVFRDKSFENISGQDASLLYAYIPVNRSEAMCVGVEIASTQGALHPWEVCLVTWPQTQGGEASVTQLDLRDIHIIENPPVSARYFAFQRKDSNSTQVVLYWYTQSVFETQSGIQEKWSKISVIDYPQDPQKYKTSEENILPIAKAIVDYLQPITTWSWLALVIAGNSPTLIGITGFLIIYASFVIIRDERKKKTRAKSVYLLVSDPVDKKILQTLSSMKKDRPIESSIASRYRELSGEDIDIEILHEKLVEAEKSDLISRKIINIDNELHIIWKTNF